MITDIVVTRLEECERVIERGLNTFIEVGAALLEIRDKRLYKNKYSTFEDYCRERWRMARNYANKMIAASVVVGNLGTNVPIPANEAQVRPLAGLPPETQKEVWQRAVETSPNGKITAAHVQEIVNSLWDDSNLRFNPDTQKAYCKYCYRTHSNWTLSSDHANPMCWECLHCNHFSSDELLEIEDKPKPHVSHNSGENEWYTPAQFIEAARLAMGSIDTDPASSDLANRTVKAKVYYTEEQDGRVQEWTGNVWMNPPYSQPLVSDFVDVFVEKYNAGEFRQACVLVNNATETNWYQSLLVFASAVCFIKGRVKFIDKNGNPSGAPLQGQTVLYFGDNVEAFANAFTGYGLILYGREH